MIINLRKCTGSALGVMFVLLGIIFMLYGVFGMDSNNNAGTKPANNIIMGEIDITKPMVALTFDDGPYTPVTDRILEALKAVNGRATFFVVGNRIKGREASICKMVEYGCEIGNHTYTHIQLNNISAAAVRDEIQKTDNAVLELTGYEIKTVRPPSGCYNKKMLLNDNRPFVLWSIDTMDWSHQNCDKTVKRVLDNIHDGDIVLMHDLFFATADAAEKIIPELVARGYQLVTVSELLEYRQESDSVVLNKG